MKLRQRLYNVLAISVAMFMLFAPLTLHSAMVGGSFEVVNDSFSYGGAETSGGGYQLYDSFENTSLGNIGTAAAGTITFVDVPGWGIDEQIVIGDGRVSVTFLAVNNAGDAVPTCEVGISPACTTVGFDIGGEGGSIGASMATRMAAAINSSLHELNVSASASGAVVTVVSNVPGPTSNITITEANDDDDNFTVSGLSGGTYAGYEVQAGFQSAVKNGITMSIDDTTMALGTLSTGSVSTDSLVMTVTTDSNSGYAVTLSETGNLISGANTIDDVADGSVTAGSEEYGFVTSGGDGTVTTDTAITSASQTIASRTTSVNGSETTVTFKAAISASASIAGVYSHTVTFTATANP